MATHSNFLAWRIPWTEEPGGLQSIGSQRVRHVIYRITKHKCNPEYFIHWSRLIYSTSRGARLIVKQGGILPMGNTKVNKVWFLFSRNS